MDLERELSRRDFLKFLGVGGFSLFLGTEKFKSPEFLSFQRLDGTIGINGGHLLGSEFNRPGASIRIPLNRQAFDPQERIPKEISERQLDPFYLTGEKLRSFRLRGGKITLVIEMDAIDVVDTPEHLAKMFLYANGFLHLGKGDQVIMGNEHNCRNYPIDIYIRQASGLYRFIKKINPEIEVGLEGEAWYGEGEYFKELLQGFRKENVFPFDLVPINFYGRPEELPEKVALYRKIMKDFKLDKPILIGEMGVRVSDNPEQEEPSYLGEIIVSPEEQVDAIWKYFCFAKLSGCQSAFWFCAQDDPESRQWPKYGLMDAEGIFRPGARAMYYTQSLLSQAEVIDYKKNKDLTEFRFLNPWFQINISWSHKSKEILGGAVRVSLRV